jgi:ketosteroid isomerase-like protein
MSRVVIALLLALALSSCATTAPPSGAADEAAIRSLEEHERLSVLNRDVAALQRVWSEHLVVNTPANRVSPDRRVVLRLVTQGEIHYAVFDRTIERMRIDGDLAIVMGGEVIQRVGSPAPPPVRRRFTHVWKRAPEGWRLVARHANVIQP